MSQTHTLLSVYYYEENNVECFDNTIFNGYMFQFKYSINLWSFDCVQMQNKSIYLTYTEKFESP